MLLPQNGGSNRVRRFSFSQTVSSKPAGGNPLGATVFRKFIGRPAQARQPRTAGPAFEAGARRKERSGKAFKAWAEKASRTEDVKSGQSVQGLGKASRKRRWLALPRPRRKPVLSLSCALEGKRGVAIVQTRLTCFLYPQSFRSKGETP